MTRAIFLRASFRLMRRGAGADRDVRARSPRLQSIRLALLPEDQSSPEHRQEWFPHQFASCTSWRLALATKASMYSMTRRSDLRTAEKLSVAPLTRAAFGQGAGTRAAILYAVNEKLIEAVFRRSAAQTRMDLIARCTFMDPT